MIGAGLVPGSVEPDQPVADVAWTALKIGAGAGPRDAFTAFRQKQRAVTGALDQPARAVEKLVGHPFQRNTAMGAAIEIHVHLRSLAYHHQHLTAAMDRKTTGIGQLIESAQRRGKEIIVVFHSVIISTTIGQRQCMALLLRHLTPWLAGIRVARSSG